MTRLILRKNLGPMRADASRRVDAAAEAVRQQFITPGSGQAMVYAAKQDEARRYLESVPPPADLTLYPLMEAEVGLTAATPHDLAVLWTTMEAAWLVAAAAIEKKRLSAKKAIEAAGSPAEILAAANVDWSAP